MQHSDVVTWSDASAFVDAGRELDGCELLARALQGDVPLDPFTTALGIRLVAAQQGSVTTEVTVGDWHTNVIGMTHGGYLSALMDQASGLAITSSLPAGSLAPHVGSSYRFARPSGIGDVLVCTAEAVSVGRTLAVARCVVTVRDKLVATGDSTHAITASAPPAS